jgi:hypothetical protein
MTGSRRVNMGEFRRLTADVPDDVPLYVVDQEMMFTSDPAIAIVATDPARVQVEGDYAGAGSELPRFDQTAGTP